MIQRLGSSLVKMPNGITLTQWLQPANIIKVDDAPYNGDLIAAYNAIPVIGNYALVLTNHTYNAVGLFDAGRNMKPNITIIGAGMPQLADDRSSFVEGSGTIIKGAVKNSAKGFQIGNLGIDCGNTVSRTYYQPARFEDPLQIYGCGANANIFIDNVKCLSAVSVDERPGTHSILLEQTEGVTLGYVECIGGFHGLTIKCRNLRGGIAHCYGQYGDGFIIKSDAGGAASHIYMERIQVGHPDQSMWPDVHLGGIYDAHDGVTIDSVSIGELHVVRGTWGLIPADNATGNITNFHIGHYECHLTYGNYYSLVINNKVVGWTMGTHNITNCSGGIKVDPASVYVNIGTGRSTNNTESGYSLGGNTLIHGELIADANGKYGVEYSGGLGLDVSKIHGFQNQLGTYSGYSSAIQSLLWPDAGFEAMVTGRTVTLRGSLTKGTTAWCGQVLDAVKPTRDIRIYAWAVGLGGSMVPVEAWIRSANGAIDVVGKDSVGEGQIVSFTGSYIFK
ncbi:phage tail protein [Salmonella enterica subsp. enterica serovar Typhimurium]|nr:phage tail protein [Salmonella enterica subsp. enterica serovar Typhimurium]